MRPVSKAEPIYSRELEWLKGKLVEILRSRCGSTISGFYDNSFSGWAVVGKIEYYRCKLP
jgi:hypothetical protein